MKSQRSSRSEWWRNYSNYLKSPQWRALRRRLYQERGGRCSDCGVKLGSRYEVHHKTYVRVGDEDLDDLDLLCLKCHRKRHPGKKLRRRRGRSHPSAYGWALLVLFLATILVATVL